MLSLVDGKPIFYIGKINGAGYISEKEKEELIKRLKVNNPDVEIQDEKIEVDKDLKEKAEKLAELKLTYSKSEFMQYLIGEKTHNLIEIERLREDNEKLSQALIEVSMLTAKENEQNKAAIIELANLVGSMM